MGAEPETLDVDVLFVGGGPANLAAALRLAQLIAEHNRRVAAGEVSGSPLEPRLALIEKGRDTGAHAISGALLNPVALAELLPDYRDRGFPLALPIREQGLYYLTTDRAVRLPESLIPRAYRPSGCYVGSLQKLNLWMARLVEQAGVSLFPETCAVEVLIEDGRVCGVRTGEKGVQADGGRRPNYEPGARLRAKVTLFGEGPRGTLAEDLIARFRLREGRAPQSYAVGVKELIRVPRAGTPGLVLHTLGYPLGSRVFGGGFCYGLEDGRYAVGLTCALDWEDPRFDPQAELQRYKKHPLIQRYIRGGEVVGYGAKTIPEGGYDALPRPYADGALLVGDAAGFVNVPALKGIHYAMKSGMLAAETVFEALLRGDGSAATLSAYEARLAASYVHRDLRAARHFRRAVAHGLGPGLLLGGFALWTGWGPRKPGTVVEDFRRLRPVAAHAARPSREPSGYDPGVLVDKLTAVHLSGTRHREDQPPHIRILEPDRCLSECLPRFGEAPCTRFCPANVYELVGDGAERRIQVNFANCLHCRTCVVKDPLDVRAGDGVQNIVWRAPAEGGPRYEGM